MYRGVVTAIDTAGLWVRIAEQGVVGPLPWTGQPPVVGGSVLVADAGQPGQPDLIVLGTVPGTAALTTVDHAVPRFDGTAGKIQTSPLTITDAGVLGGLANGSASGDAVNKSQLDGKPNQTTGTATMASGWSATYTVRWVRVGAAVTVAGQVAYTGTPSSDAVICTGLPKPADAFVFFGGAHNGATFKRFYLSQGSSDGSIVDQFPSLNPDYTVNFTYTAA